MKYEKVPATNANENDIAAYCANNNIEISLGNAHDVTIRTFKLNPIMQLDSYGVPHNVTERVARFIECQPTTIARIAEKTELIKVELQQENFRKNIQKAQIDAIPDLTKLVKNLYRLNIVDENSYLALVCFLMQLKYSRDHEIPTNDKTCVFFNGVARNGKSATAKAICDVESQYGTVFKAQSGKLLESTHEEQVWKSHLNYFDEVKPTDIDRELLLTIVNGGEVEINPKNKKPYNYHVNTNNIFTSNDQISLKQRRVSIIKFGNRLSGRPLGAEALIDIVTNIINSLPSFDHYYNLYDIVSVYNENRINALAISNIITYISEKFGFVNASNEISLTSNLTFAPHDIYNCVQNVFTKQIITSERKEAIRTALNYLEEQNLIHRIDYDYCSTKYYSVDARSYIKIMEIYNDINTKYETNIKVTEADLYQSLSRFFDNVPTTNLTETQGE